ncbi:MAG: hypothetical protein KKC54_07870, partial [Nanoarchaeota archaeon]|nr:hypothetical protein [Nanoarchaeota archaeon]
LLGKVKKRKVLGQCFSLLGKVKKRKVLGQYFSLLQHLAALGNFYFMKCFSKTFIYKYYE